MELPYDYRINDLDPWNCEQSTIVTLHMDYSKIDRPIDHPYNDRISTQHKRSLAIKGTLDMYAWCDVTLHMAYKGYKVSSSMQGLSFYSRMDFYISPERIKMLDDCLKQLNSAINTMQRVASETIPDHLWPSVIKAIQYRLNNRGDVIDLQWHLYPNNELYAIVTRKLQYGSSIVRCNFTRKGDKVLVKMCNRQATIGA